MDHPNKQLEEFTPPADSDLLAQALPRPSGQAALDAIVGESEPVRRIKSMLPRVAASPASTVLITGESGTGKDLAAHAIHELSDRRTAPFVNITCSALPANLLESELFGHERGAFTDAKARHAGLFEQANGGTVFLDEIGELELSLQAKLLHVLETKTLRPVGGTKEISADARVVAATNVDLQEAVRNGSFREDLYYRLAVVTLHQPPLRERGDDIDLLANVMLQKFNEEFGTSFEGISPGASKLLRSHSWPGNVRELRNVVERAVLLSAGPLLDVEDFHFLQEMKLEEPRFRLPAGGCDLRDVERSLLEQALERTNGNKTRAARLLGLNRDQVRYRMHRYGMIQTANGHN